MGGARHSNTLSLSYISLNKRSQVVEPGPMCVFGPMGLAGHAGLCGRLVNGWVAPYTWIFFFAV